ncbi:pyocin knob domain-containing protein [Lentilactobacillus buchneri]
MPAGKDGAATAAISPKYASALSRSATVSLNPDQAGTVTPEYVDQKIQQIISQGIVNAGSTLSESDNLDSFITTGYHLIKGSLPLSAPEDFSTNGQIIVYGNKDTTDGVTQLAYDDINGTSYVRSYNPTNNKWSDWDLVITKSQLNAVLPTDIARTGENNDFKGKNTFETDPTDSAGNAYAKTVDVNQQLDKKVNIADMRKPASDVAGIEEVSSKQDKIGYTPADDSEVAHLSGANNFDTVPTVNNNPLLLASSLPSDLARTSQQTNFTAGLQSGGVPVATSDDLKSVENSAWHTVTLPNSQGLKSITMIYKNHEDDKYIEANIYANSVHTTIYACTMLDLSGIVNRITDIDLLFVSYSSNGFLNNDGSTVGSISATAAGAKISLPSNCEIYSPTNIAIMSNSGGSFAKIYYDSLVNN